MDEETPETGTQDLSDEQMDSLIQDSEPSLNDEMPEDQPAPAKTFKFKANGKDVEANEDQLLKWASQGHNYAQHMQEFKQQQEDLNKKLTEYDSKYSLYDKIDKYAAENRDWWDHVLKSYNKTSNPASEQDQFNSIRNEFSKEIEDLRSFKNDFLAAEKAKREASEDAALKAEVKKVREIHQDLDWSNADQEGKNLEQKIMEHAVNNGINSFDIAFKSFMHDELLNRARQTGLDSARKEFQRNTKLGLIGEKFDPLQKMVKETNIKLKSYDDLEREALEEFQIAN